MKALGTVLTLCAITLCFSGCQQQAPPDTHDADVKAIGDNETQWNADYKAKDSAKVVAHYADDAVLMAPGMEAAKGKDAIGKLLGQMMTDPAMALTFQADKI